MSIFFSEMSVTGVSSLVGGGGGCGALVVPADLADDVEEVWKEVKYDCLTLFRPKLFDLIQNNQSTANYYLKTRKLLEVKQMW